MTDLNPRFVVLVIGAASLGGLLAGVAGALAATALVCLGAVLVVPGFLLAADHIDRARMRRRLAAGRAHRRSR